MIIAFSNTREQVRGERHDGAHGQQFRYIDQDLEEHAQDPINRRRDVFSRVVHEETVATPKWG